MSAFNIKTIKETFNIELQIEKIKADINMPTINTTVDVKALERKIIRLENIIKALLDHYALDVK